MKRSDPVLPSPSGHIPSVAVCQVCGEALGARAAVTCATCATPHHEECWNYQRRCSTYGCGSRGYLPALVQQAPPPPPDHGALVPAALPAALDVELPLEGARHALAVLHEATLGFLGRIGLFLFLCMLQTALGLERWLWAELALALFLLAVLASLGLVLESFARIVPIHRTLRLLTRIDPARNTLTHGYHYAGLVKGPDWAFWTLTMPLAAPRIALRECWFEYLEVCAVVDIHPSMPKRVPLGRKFRRNTPDALRQIRQVAELAQILDWPVQLPGDEWTTQAYQSAAASLPALAPARPALDAGKTM